MSDVEYDLPDYATLPIPDKPKRELNHHERRSMLYNWLEQAGHPRNLERSQADIGKEFGVSQQQISKDIQAVKDSIGERIGEDAESKTQLVCESAVRNLMDDGDFERAAKLQLKYYDWLFDTGVREKEPEQHNISMENAWKQALSNDGED